jgi:hypothetical protein
LGFVETGIGGFFKSLQCLWRNLHSFFWRIPQFYFSINDEVVKFVLQFKNDIEPHGIALPVDIEINQNRFIGIGKRKYGFQPQNKEQREPGFFKIFL